MKSNTIDFDNNNKELISRVIAKIWECPNLFSFETKLSQHKGVTFCLICRIDCDLCRFVFDDEIRYGIDIQRLLRHQNIVWSEKELLSLNKRVYYGKF
jgi:hypothetical protein